jgi:hypothetical protein
VLQPFDHAQKVHVAEIYDRAEALEVIARSEADYAARFGHADQRLLELRRLLGR